MTVNTDNTHLELHGPHTAADDEGVPLVDGSVRFKEVGLEVHLEPVAGQTLHAVVDGEYVDPLAVLDVRAGLDGHNIPEPHPQVVTNLE